MKNIFIHLAFAIPKPEGSGVPALFAGISLVLMALSAKVEIFPINININVITFLAHTIGVNVVY